MARAALAGEASFEQKSEASVESSPRVPPRGGPGSRGMVGGVEEPRGHCGGRGGDKSRGPHSWGLSQAIVGLDLGSCGL